jgi:hypothetical protein
MTGQQFRQAVRDGDAAKVNTLLSTQGAATQGAQSFIKHQANYSATALQLADDRGHAGIVTLIRNKKHKGADRGKKDTLLQASPEEIKKQLEDARSFKPHFVRHSQVLNSLWKLLHLGVRDDMVGFPHPQSIIQLHLLVLVMITRRCCLSRQLAYADVS